MNGFKQILADVKFPFRIVALILVLALAALYVYALRITDERYIQGFYHSKYSPELNQILTESPTLQYPLRELQDYVTSFWEPSPKIETLILNIKKKRFDSLHEERLNAKVWDNSAKKKYPISINWNSQLMPAKISLKGIGNDHRQSDSKFSVAIELKGDNYFLGMKSFSLHQPKIRGYWSECLWGDVSLYLGVIAPRCGFVNVIVNGEQIGLMNFVERFSTNLLEANKRKAGVLLAVDDDNLWKMQNTPLNAAYRDRLKLPLNEYESKRVTQSDELSRQVGIARENIRAVINNEISLERVFDVENLSSAYAVLIMSGSLHGQMLHNLKFFYNPLTGLIEIIPTDFGAIGIAMAGSIFKKADSQSFFPICVKNKFFQLALKKKLAKIKNEFDQRTGIYSYVSSRANYWHAILKREDFFLPRYNPDLTQLWIEHVDRVFQDQQVFDLSPLLENDLFDLASVRDPVLSIPENVELDNPVKSIVYSYGNKKVLHIQNQIPTEITIKRIYFIEAGREKIIGTEIGTLNPSFHDTVLRGIDKASSVEFVIDDSFSSKEIIVEIAIPAQGSKTYSLVSSEVTKAERPFVLPTVSHEMFQRKYARIFTFESGQYSFSGKAKFNDPVIFPQGAQVFIGSGSTLEFSENSGMFLNQGQLEIEGSQQQPVILKGVESKNWSGIYILNGNLQGKHSSLRWVQFHNLDAYNIAPLSLTGAINFNNSKVSFDNVRVANVKAEDAVNIMNSQINVRQLSIRNASSDGFDGDFISGEISDLSMSNIGGDGLDISGSNIELVDSDFEYIGDKAISIGEKSIITGRSVRISHVGSGIVSKDGSSGTFTDVQVNDFDVAALMSYIKKPQYGSAKLDIKTQTGTLTGLCQHGNLLSINGQVLATIDLDVKRMYSDGPMLKVGR